MTKKMSSWKQGIQFAWIVIGKFTVEEEGREGWTPVFPWAVPATPRC